MTKQDILSSSRATERSVFGNLTLHIGKSTQLSGRLRYIQIESLNSVRLDAVNTLKSVTRATLQSTPLNLVLGTSFAQDTDKLNLPDVSATFLHS